MLIAGIATVGMPYYGIAWRYSTHVYGSPEHTTLYVDYPDVPIARFAVAGDIGEPGVRLDATADAIADIGRRDPYEALLLLGDNVYPNGDPSKLQDVVFKPFAPVLDEGTDLLAILGNHDVKDGNAIPQLRELGMPGRWWSRTYADGRVLVIGLDSTELESVEQRHFLDSTLAGSTATWKIVALHHPPYSAGYQGSSEDVRVVFSPVFAYYGVQLVLSGHDHDYQRSEPIDGVTYVVSGAGATTRRTGRDSFTEVSFSWHHFVEVAVFDDHLVVRAINQDLDVADEATLQP